MRHGLGYRRDPAHKRTQIPFHQHPLFMAAAPPPPAASNESSEAPIEDQSQTGSCTGHGSSQGIATTAAANGTPLSFVPSPRGIYADTRSLERSDALPPADPNAPAAPLPPLQDNGAMPADIFRAVCPAPGTPGGVRKMNPTPPTVDGRFSDVTVENVNDEETLADIESENPVCGDYRIPCAADGNATQAGVVLQMKIALAGKCAVGIGVFVDTNFENWSVGQSPLSAAQLDLNDFSGGGHWLCVTSYRTDTTTGRTVFRGPNSWGPSWGDQGHFEVDETWLYASASDIYVFTPRIAATATPEPVTNGDAS